MAKQKELSTAKERELIRSVVKRELSIVKRKRRKFIQPRGTKCRVKQRKLSKGGIEGTKKCE